jgi:hypothetical protein
MEVQNYASVA